MGDFTRFRVWGSSDRVVKDKCHTGSMSEPTGGSASFRFFAGSSSHDPGYEAVDENLRFAPGYGVDHHHGYGVVGVRRRTVSAIEISLLDWNLGSSRRTRGARNHRCVPALELGLGTSASLPRGRIPQFRTPGRY